MDYLTEQGRIMMNRARNKGLLEFYDEYSGNFVFSDSELELNKTLIKEWLKENQEYCLIYCEDFWIMLPQENLE